MMEDSEDNRLDESLRNLFSDFHLPPTDQVWQGIAKQLPARPAPRPARRRRLLPALLPLVALLSFVGGRLWPVAAPVRPEPQRIATTAPATSGLSAGLRPQGPARELTAACRPLRPAADLARTALHRPAPDMPLLPAPAIASPAAASPDSSQIIQTRSELNTRSGWLVTASADSLPATVRSFVALERRLLQPVPDTVRRALGFVSRAEIVATLRAEQAELGRLRRRNDSLLLALGTPPTVPALAATPLPPAPADTTRLRPVRRWSLLATVTPEQNYQQLQTSPNDTMQALRRHQEVGRKGLSAAVMGEYRLNQRVSVGAGLGYTRAGAELRVADQRTDISVRYDTTISHTTDVFSSTHTVYSVRLIQIPQLSPVFNSSGQVIRYDTVYISRPDTLRTVIVQNDTVRNTRRTITPLIDKRETTTYRTLKPIYHFFTVPVQLRYRLTPPSGGRWWADATVGAQIQLFLGGSQLVTDDGHRYRTEKVRVAEGPFRPLNLALMGSLALNYALTSHLSVSVAPAVRWQALSVYKTATGLRQQSTATGLQLGVRWQF
ncbi:hypothetical protein E5K00_15900 [Hymenobacter aquaticus]|uniref:Outer membrane protein beta-barrel domain-containing protein n=1 Tax=Hymenobacter aquaticus TaxID=1867101 RepID=A0A4Z0PXV1_9BACT|nr:hypothetical protein [Hymenobacter aquaticus]TGE21751.1 hypothetical protein E5K00_15900 [Hymenobacter aquaticus]